MAAERTDAPTPDRIFLTSALALLAAAAGAAFGRVFAGTASTVGLAAAGGVAVMLGGALARRNILLAAGTSALALLAAIGWFVFPQTTALGLPTIGTLDALSRALAKLGAHAASEVTPATPLPSLLSASLIAVWCAGFAAHVLAVRAGAPVLALLPPAVIVGFASTLVDDGPRPLYAGIFVVTGLVVLLMSGLRRLGAWGASPSPRRDLVWGPQAALARRLTGIALVFTVVLPGVVPGLRGDSILELRAPGEEDRAGLSPIVDIRPSLYRDPGVELFRVRSERPAYWRLLSLERFDGRVWTSGSPTTVRGPRLTGQESLTHWGIRGPALDEEQVLEQEVEIANLRTSWLPMAYEPLAFDLGDGTARFDPSRTALAPEDDLPEGFRYRVESVLTIPTPSDLEAVHTTDSPSPSRVDTELPADLPGEIHRLAQEIAAGETTDYGRVMAIQRHLRSFTYDLEAPAGHDTDDLLFFLQQSRRGYCEQFAAAMAVLVRSLGYGARVALGFTAGAPGPDGRYVVTTKNAHAWPEVYFPGYGWLAFEPTPSRSNPVAAEYAAPATAVPGGSRLGEIALTQHTAAGARQRDAAERGPDAPAPAPDEEQRRSRGPLVGLGIVAAVAALAAWALRRQLRGRRALRRARGARARVIAAYGLFAGRTRDAGLGRGPAETPAEYRARLAREIAPSAELDRLTLLATDALYSARPIGGDEAERATSDAIRLLRVVRRQVGAHRVLLGTLRVRR